MMDFYGILLINAIFTLFVGVWLFRYFTDIFNMQSKIVDDILQHLKNKQDTLKVDEGQTSLNDYLEEE